MNELTETKLAKPLDKMALGNDVAALNNLVGFLNSPLSGGEADRASGETSLAEAMAAVSPTSEAQAVQVAANPLAKQPGKLVAEVRAKSEQQGTDPETVAARVNLSRAFYTGRMCVGKDYVAGLTGATIEGFALPLYTLAKYFFGVDVSAAANKDLPGMRAFLQTAGQWGRGTVNAQYPYSTARAAFIATVRAVANEGAFDDFLGVCWDDYGRTENIWLNAALARISAAAPERVAITNVRFANESKELLSQGWLNWHVMTSPDEWAARLAKRKMDTKSPVLRDVSEQMADALDRQVIAEVSRSRTGRKLRVIWNSDKPVPSARLWTVNEFLQAAKIAVPVQGGSDDTGIFIGE